MATLVQDIVTAAEWIAKALNESGYQADFSMASLREIDRFFDENSADGRPLPDGLLGKNLGNRIFALGGYVGEVIRRAAGGQWRGDDADPQGEINIALTWGDDSMIWPVQRVMKRLQNGRDDGLFPYGMIVADRMRSSTAP
jgi:hypothetical protein